MKFILLYGAPGVGKYTVAKELETITHYKLLHNHTILNALSDIFGFHHPARKKLEKEFRLRIVEEAVEANVDLIATGVVMRDNEQFYRQIVSLVEDAGGECVVVHLTADRETIMSRIKHDSRKTMNKISTMERFNEWSKQYPESFDKKYFHSQLTFDTSNAKPEETVQAIIKALDVDAQRVSV